MSDVELFIDKDFNTKNVVFIGAGFVGAISSVVLACKCPHLDITVIDKDGEKIDSWNSNKIPLYEPYLEDLLNTVKNINIRFTTDAERWLIDADMVFICVNTPTKAYGIGKGRAPDMSFIETSALMIREFCRKKNVVVVEKSTVPVRSAEKIAEVFIDNTEGGTQFYVISNPEFLSQGNAIYDTMYPDRILIGGMIGTMNKKALEAVRRIYLNWIPPQKIITTDVWSAELTKLSANAFLAQRISSVNSISAICAATGANIKDVAYSVGLDSRIGDQFLAPSLGFGGSCFTKDLLCLVYICESLSLPEVANYWHQVIDINNYQRKRFVKLIISTMFENIWQKVICIYGIAFKNNTSDIRESSSLYVMDKMMKEGARIVLYDPQADPQHVIKEINQMNQTSNKEYISRIEERIAIESDPYSAARNANAIVICTEWDTFKDLEYDKIYNSMQKPAYIFDGRLILNGKQMKDIGFNYNSI